MAAIRHCVLQEGSSQARATAPAAKAAEEPKGIPAPPDVAGRARGRREVRLGPGLEGPEEGTGTEHPGPEDTVRVDYTGWMTDGKMFDSSVTRGGTRSSRSIRSSRGGPRGLQLMVEGESAAFGSRKPGLWRHPTPARRPFGTLVFDVNLRGIKKAPPAPPVPKDVAGPPKDAKKTASGLAYKVLTKGKGKVHPPRAAW